MPKYLFTSDQRISELPKKIKWVAQLSESGYDTSLIKDKSENNNASTLKFYYNLQIGTELAHLAATNPLTAIRNFAKKFQFPNTRTIDSFKDSIEEGTLLAPIRIVVNLLYTMGLEDKEDSYLTMDEILYFLFVDKEVYANPEFDFKNLIKRIQGNRLLNKDIENLIRNNLTWKQYNRQVKEMMSILKYCATCFNLKDRYIYFRLSLLDDGDNRDFIEDIINYNLLWYPSDVNNYQQANKEYISYMDIAITPYSVIELHSETKQDRLKFNIRSLQQIFYGAPGTGKSYTINDITKKERAKTIRTTFHPDTDYSSFVGAYKPTTIEEPVMTVIGTKAVPVENADGTPRIESKIVYEFVSQSFLKAYVNAWKLYSKINEANNVEKQFLVIEEINRGNCAQIFGDLFQLLDRNEYGFSDYPIEADADMQKQLRKEFVGLEIPLHDDINALYKDAERDIVEEVLQGKILLLPNNLYIWATMNTSDQSLFPIDSAFKRRWDWEYMPISNANKDWIITVNHQSYDWWKFLEAINKLIGNTTYSEDKKLGYFFCKAQDNVISAERFVGKVIFYLWNDVFKDYGFEGEAFTDQEGGKLSFDKFYVSTDHRHHEVNENKVEMFLKNLGLEPITNNITEDDENQNVDVEGNKKKSFKVNNINVGNINAIPYTTIQEFIRLNPGMKANDVYQKWEPLKKCSSKTWLLDDEEAHQTRKIESPTEAKYSEKVICGDNKPVYVNKDGWMHNPMKQRDTLTEFIEEVHKLNLGITITEL